MHADPSPPPRLEPGTPAYRRANLAMFLGGFATFSVLYGTQPLLPQLAAMFGISASTVSLSVTAGTAALALLLIPASVAADRWGRERVMKCSLAASALLALACATVSDFHTLLVLRVLLGAAVAGLPASAMAWLGDEVAPAGQGQAVGLYIAGNAFGGMSGRFLAALVSEWWSWRWGLASVGLLGALATLVFWRALPHARHFTPRPARLAPLLRDAGSILGDAGLRALFLTGFLLMGAFVSIYNYVGFRLSAAPYGLGPSAIGAVFLLYLVGSASSTWTGRLTDRLGRRQVLWLMAVCMGMGIAITLASPLPAIILGVAVFTFGFFGAHATASGWAGRRAHERPALASALYLCSYYLGGSVLGSLCGLAWDHARWPGVVATLALFVVAPVLAIAMRLRAIPARMQPVAQPAG